MSNRRDCAFSVKAPGNTKDELTKDFRENPEQVRAFSLSSKGMHGNIRLVSIRDTW